MYRRRGDEIRVLLVHPGGPYFRGKDLGAWSIPKGEVEPGEELLDAAVREFEEEIGLRPRGPFLPLTPIKQRGGKQVCAWYCQGTSDVVAANSGKFTIEWPPKSGRYAEFPEIDKAEYFPLELARQKVNPAQTSFLDELQRNLSAT